MKNPQQGTLYLVATPIGNLSDISKRALETLHSSDFIAAEDTRVTRKLLSHYGIKKKVVSYYKFNRSDSGEKIIGRVLEGETCALVTDAGTPGISDPGEDLVNLCVSHNIEVVVIPGPCAAVAALTLSGLSAARFTFEGFLPTQKKKRLALLASLISESRTMVFYEAPHKLITTLSDMLETLGDRRISVSRELTKVYDETLRLSLSDAVAYFEKNPPRGEFVLVVEGCQAVPKSEPCLDEAASIALKLIEDGSSVKDATKKAAVLTGCSKNAIYDRVISPK